MVSLLSWFIIRLKVGTPFHRRTRLFPGCFFRMFAVFYKRWYVRAVYLLWFFGMLAGTVTLRVHNIIDVMAGILIAEAVFYGVYMGLTRRRMDDLNRHFSIKQEIIFIVIISACLAAFLFYFIRHYGVHTIL